MKYVLFAMAAFSLIAGYLPTETNNVDLLSMANFLAACYMAYVAGAIK